jgi:hypothetical protein
VHEKLQIKIEIIRNFKTFSYPGIGLISFLSLNNSRERKIRSTGYLEGRFFPDWPNGRREEEEQQLPKINQS